MVSTAGPKVQVWGKRDLIKGQQKNRFPVFYREEMNKIRNFRRNVDISAYDNDTQVGHIGNGADDHGESQENVK